MSARKWGCAGRIQLLKCLVWEEQSPQLASNWPMWLQPPPQPWAALWRQASFSSLFPQWPGWSWGRPPRPLTSSREGDLAPRAREVRTFSLGSSGPRARQPRSRPWFPDPHGRKGLCSRDSLVLPGGQAGLFAAPRVPGVPGAPPTLLGALSLPLRLSLSLRLLSCPPWCSALWLGVGVGPNPGVESVHFPPVCVVIGKKTRDSSQ